MASIRRTLSPANHDRQIPSSLFQNGSSSTVTQWTSKSSNSRFSVNLRRLFFAVGTSPLSKPPSRRSSWRKPIYRCLVFFIFGFLLGILRFDSIDDDIRIHDFSFDNLRINDVVLKVEEEKMDSTLKNDVVSKADQGKNGDTEPLDKMSVKLDHENPRKSLIVVTPTYNRVLQAYYLNRLGQVLRLVNPPLLWIVVEMNAQSSETGSILRNLGIMYRHLVSRKNSTDVKDRGVHQRNIALQHIELHRLDGIVYFADDDNVYSLELFEQIRDISRLGTWPVAMLTQNKNKAVLEGPVCNGSQVIGWHTNEKSKMLRRFHVDMSGFAFNSTILWDSKRWKRPFPNPVRQLDTVKEGFQETTFLEQVVEEESQMEGIPHGCGRIMNWHLHLEARGVEYPRGWILPKNLDAVFSID